MTTQSKGGRSGAGAAARQAGDIDLHLGRRIRERRIMLGLSQQQMARMIGITYQQAHKYERGINRLSAGRVYEVAKVLGVPVSYLFEGLEAPSAEMASRQRLCLELARNFANIVDEKQQEALCHLARTMTGAG